MIHIKNLFTLGLVYTLLTAGVQATLANPPLSLSDHVYQGSTVPLLKHTGPGEWDNYLTMNLPFAPISHLFTQLQQLFIAKGGTAALFSAEKYYPHITLGYTLKDLHESDGIIKDSSTCQESIKILSDPSQGAQHGHQELLN